MVIYKDIPSVVIEAKIWHIHKIGGKLHRDFTKDCGDIPVCNYNEITKEFEDVVNSRGYAYAHRNSKKFRKNKSDKFIKFDKFDNEI